MCVWGGGGGCRADTGLKPVWDITITQSISEINVCELSVNTVDGSYLK